MFLRLFIAAVSLTVVACNNGGAASGVMFDVKAEQMEVWPENVVLRVQNNSDDYLCFPLVESRLNGASMEVLPANGSDSFENRVPPHLLGGLDVIEGLAVVPPRKAAKYFIDVEALEGREPQARELRGTINGTTCRALFSSPSPPLTRRSFRVKLLALSEQR